MTGARGAPAVNEAQIDEARIQHREMQAVIASADEEREEAERRANEARADSADAEQKSAVSTGKLDRLQSEVLEFQQRSEALQREDKQLYSSLVKETMKRKQPQFSEEYHGYRSFSRLLEDAQEHNLISIAKDARSGTYVINEILEDTT